MLRPLFVWVFFMFYPVLQKDGTERPDEVFSWLQLGGYIILVTGVLVYNEILVVPFFGFNRNTKVAIEKRTREENYNKTKRSSDETFEY